MINNSDQSKSFFQSLSGVGKVAAGKEKLFRTGNSFSIVEKKTAGIFQTVHEYSVQDLAKLTHEAIDQLKNKKLSKHELSGLSHSFNNAANAISQIKTDALPSDTIHQLAEVNHLIQDQIPLIEDGLSIKNNNPPEHSIAKFQEILGKGYKISNEAKEALIELFKKDIGNIEHLLKFLNFMLQSKREIINYKQEHISFEKGSEGVLMLRSIKEALKECSGKCANEVNKLIWDTVQLSSIFNLALCEDSINAVALNENFFVSGELSDEEQKKIGQGPLSRYIDRMQRLMKADMEEEASLADKYQLMPIEASDRLEHLHQTRGYMPQDGNIFGLAAWKETRKSSDGAIISSTRVLGYATPDRKYKFETEFPLDLSPVGQLSKEGSEKAINFIHNVVAKSAGKEQWVIDTYKALQLDPNMRIEPPKGSEFEKVSKLDFLNDDQKQALLRTAVSFFCKSCFALAEITKEFLTSVRYDLPEIQEKIEKLSGEAKNPEASYSRLKTAKKEAAALRKHIEKINEGAGHITASEKENLAIQYNKLLSVADAIEERLLPRSLKQNMTQALGSGFRIDSKIETALHKLLQNSEMRALIEELFTEAVAQKKITKESRTNDYPINYLSSIPKVFAIMTEINMSIGTVARKLGISANETELFSTFLKTVGQSCTVMNTQIHTDGLLSIFLGNEFFINGTASAKNRTHGEPGPFSRYIQRMNRAFQTEQSTDSKHDVRYTPADGNRRELSLWENIRENKNGAIVGGTRVLGYATMDYSDVLRREIPINLDVLDLKNLEESKQVFNFLLDFDQESFSYTEWAVNQARHLEKDPNFPIKNVPPSVQKMLDKIDFLDTDKKQEMLKIALTFSYEAFVALAEMNATIGQK